ncbi:hypothetical protein HYS97_02590 [Candidatus Daviesbacteria bacterium]|nr:hypothetical protein [Candidatus Daviesbacteria bacterium]
MIGRVEPALQLGNWVPLAEVVKPGENGARVGELKFSRPADASVTFRASTGSNGRDRFWLQDFQGFTGIRLTLISGESRTTIKVGRLSGDPKKPEGILGHYVDPYSGLDGAATSIPLTPDSFLEGFRGEQRVVALTVRGYQAIEST